MYGAQSFIRVKMLNTLSLYIKVIYSRVSSSSFSLPPPPPPALFTNIFTFPKFFIVSSTRFFKSSSIVTLHFTAKAFTPNSAASLAVSLAFSISKSLHTTSAPASANFKAEAFPIPSPAPVIIAIFPFKSYCSAIFIKIISLNHFSSYILFL